MITQAQSTTSIHSYSYGTTSTTTNVSNQSSATSKNTQNEKVSSLTSTKQIQDSTDGDGIVLTSQDGDLATFSSTGLQKAQELFQTSSTNSTQSSGMTSTSNTISVQSASTSATSATQVTGTTYATGTTTATQTSSTNTSVKATSSDLSQYTISELKEMLSDGTISRSEYNAEIESRTDSMDKQEERTVQMEAQEAAKNRIQQTASQSPSAILTALNVTI